VIAFASAMVGITALSAAVAGYMFRPLSWLQRGFLVAVSLAAISPHLTVSVATSLTVLAFAAWEARSAARDSMPTTRALPGRGRL
jgi:TRAP-type uncharacterized transport system fused permease subunit